MGLSDRVGAKSDARLFVSPKSGAGEYHSASEHHSATGGKECHFPNPQEWSAFWECANFILAHSQNAIVP